MSNEVRLAIAQVNLLVGDFKGNTQKIIDWSNKARDELKADVVIFPELAITGYPPEDLLLRPGLHERVADAIQQLKDSVTGITIVVGYAEYTEQGIYNAALVIRDGTTLANARKHNLPNYSVFDEKRYFKSGAGGAVFEQNGAHFGVLLCEDAWFAEPSKTAIQHGAEILLSINASPYHTHKYHERESVIQQRVSENRVPVVYTNLVGGQDELVFDGESFVINAVGDVVQRLPAFEEKLEVVLFKKENAHWRPQKNQCSELLSEEASIYQALVLGVRDYVQKNDFGGVVLGLSGGIDSALTLAIAVDALGAEQVEAVLMPSQYTAEMSITDAKEEAKALGIRYSMIPIEPAFAALTGSLADEFAGYSTDTTEENIQARCRGIILMAISNKKNKMLLTTGNKSEMAVGYATLYGDMAGGFAVIKDVSKLMVYRLSEYRNRLSKVIPQRVIDRPPSAELAPNQQDTDSLPPYDVLDAILERYVELDEGMDDIVAAGFEPAIVKRIIGLVDRNEYKRRQAAPGIRITPRAFGRDRRYPITSGYNKQRN
jgi:NAD+ synthase (glutamine-hydrolysing)